MDGTRTGGPHAYAESAGVLGVAAGHERSRFLVAHADVTDPVAALAQRLDQGIDAIADDPEYALRAPGDQRLDHNVRGIEVVAKCRARLTGDIRLGLGSLG